MDPNSLSSMVAYALKVHEAKIAAMRAKIEDYEKVVATLKVMSSKSYLKDLLGSDDSTINFAELKDLPATATSRQVLLDVGLQQTDFPVSEFPKKTPSSRALKWLKALNTQSYTVMGLARLCDGGISANIKTARAFVNNYRARYGFLDRDGTGMLHLTEKGRQFVQYLELNPDAYRDASVAADDTDDDEL